MLLHHFHFYKMVQKRNECNACVIQTIQTIYVLYDNDKDITLAYGAIGLSKQFSRGFWQLFVKV